METTDKAFLIEEKIDIVTYLIKVEGKEVSRERHVSSINVQLGINKIPAANFTIIDGEPAKNDFEISSSNEFLPGKKIEIFLGYKGNNKLVFKGIIISASNKANNHCSELNVSCKHEAEAMTVNKSNAHFKKQISASEIAEELLNKNKIGNPDVQSNSLKHEQLIQSNVSDWDFMIGRLDVANMICLFHEGKIVIKELKIKDPPKNESGEMLKLVYGKNILEFDADMDSRIPSDTVHALSWDFKEQKVRETENGDTGVKEKDEQGKVKKVAPRHELRTTAHLTEQELKAIATAKKTRQDLSKIKGRVKYLGTITANPADFVELEGVGKKLSGKAFVSAIQHDYSDGCWITEATLGWNEQFFSKEVNPGHAASETGQPSTIQGLHIAVVTNIEDSDGEYRVQVKLPMVDNKSEGLHARVATLDAGNKRGTFFRPEIDDEVVVGFLNDDPSNPVLLGMLHSNKKAAPLEPEKNNDKKGYVSRSEIKLIFDDGKKSIRIETPGKRVFEMNDDEGKITVSDNDGNKIVIEKTGITMEAAQDINIKAGKSLSIKSPQISIKADTTLEAEGSASTTVKSGGMTEIKGGLVKIN